MMDGRMVGGCVIKWTDIWVGVWMNECMYRRVGE